MPDKDFSRYRSTAAKRVARNLRAMKAQEYLNMGERTKDIGVLAEIADDTPKPLPPRKGAQPLDNVYQEATLPLQRKEKSNAYEVRKEAERKLEPRLSKRVP